MSDDSYYKTLELEGLLLNLLARHRVPDCPDCGQRLVWDNVHHAQMSGHEKYPIWEDNKDTYTQVWVSCPICNTRIFESAWAWEVSEHPMMLWSVLSTYGRPCT